MLLENFKELSFEDTFQNFFLLYSRIVTNWSSKYEMFSLVGRLGESLFFPLPCMGLMKFLRTPSGFMKFQKF